MRIISDGTLLSSVDQLKGFSPDPIEGLNRFVIAEFTGIGLAGLIAYRRHCSLAHNALISVSALDVAFT